MATTFSQLIRRTISRLSLVNGSAVQTYAEDRIGEYIQHKFDVLFDEAWWPQFLGTTTLTLDGVSGTHTSDVSLIIKRLQDVRKVFPNNSDQFLTKLPTTINASRLSGAYPLYIAGHSDPTKVFTIYPINASGDINVTYRTKPNAFLPNDIVNFDEQALVIGAAYDYATDDATNPMQIDKLSKMFESRVTQLKSALMDMPATLDPMFPSANTTWRQV